LFLTHLNWRRRQHVPSEQWYTTIRLHGITGHKTSVLMFIVLHMCVPVTMPVSSNSSNRKEPLIAAITEGTEEARFVVFCNIYYEPVNT
jgi:hypothetical protein